MVFGSKDEGGALVQRGLLLSGTELFVRGHGAKNVGLRNDR